MGIEQQWFFKRFDIYISFFGIPNIYVINVKFKLVMSFAIFCVGTCWEMYVREMCYIMYYIIWFGMFNFLFSHKYFKILYFTRHIPFVLNIQLALKDLFVKWISASKIKTYSSNFKEKGTEVGYRNSLQRHERISNSYNNNQTGDEFHYHLDCYIPSSIRKEF